MPSTWTDLARSAWDAANSLASDEHARSCASRAYYAAYCAVTAALLQADPSLQFARGWRNPHHSDLPRYIRNNLPRLPQHKRRTLAASLRFLRETRTDADYRPWTSVDKALARDARREAAIVLGELGVLQ